jgi:TetR/AcrR family transcriptional regulator of autoinduction and epiphytic fitness
MESNSQGSLASRKRLAILDAATAVFLESGFERANMDIISTRANVSKRTVYNYYGSKEVLFGAIVQRLWAEFVPPLISPKMRGKGPRFTLTQLASQIIRLLTDPRIIALLRVVVAESQRAPELSVAFYRNGKEPVLKTVAEYLQAEHKARRLKIPDAGLAARQFLGLFKEILFWPTMLGVPVPGGAERERVIEAAVDVFLCAYRGPARSPRSMKTSLATSMPFNAAGKPA